MNRNLALELDVTIRPATDEDLDQLEWFGHQRALRPHIAEVLERRVRNETELLVAVANDFAVARLGIDFTRRYGKGLLWSFAVIPNLQGLGIGTALIGEAESIVRQRGLDAVEIDAGKDDPRARALYERLGYRIVGKRQEEWTYTDEQGRSVLVNDDDWVLSTEL
ncbi:MAG: GNAT family N-acetyltransferase [Gaiellaceae bacterium]